MGLYLNLFVGGVISLIVVTVLSWMLSKVLDKDKERFNKQEAYSLHPAKWNFLDALDRIYAKGL